MAGLMRACSTLLRLLVGRAFGYFGGVPAQVVSDKRAVVRGPVRCMVAGRARLARDIRLTHWILKVNPHAADFCNNARSAVQTEGFTPIGGQVGLPIDRQDATCPTYSVSVTRMWRRCIQWRGF